MGRNWMILAIASVVSAALVPPASAQTLETITTSRGIKQSFIVLKPEKPVATVLLLAGGHGGLGLTSATAMKWGAGNFLVRTRQLFADQGLMAVVVDAPADKSSGMNAVFRMAGAHAQDIDSIAAHMRKIADVPVWAVGTSMGTFSAANAGLASKGISGVVLTSTITKSAPQWNIRTSHPDGVASMALGQLRKPTMVLAHAKDGCDLSPASGANVLKSRLTAASNVEVKVLDGGLPPQSEPCEARSPHGYLGIEKQAVAAIAAFIKGAAK